MKRIILRFLLLAAVVMGAGTATAAPDRPTADAIGRELASIRAVAPALSQVGVMVWDRVGGYVFADTILLRPDWNYQAGWNRRDDLWHSAGEALAAKRVTDWHDYVTVRHLNPADADPQLLPQTFAEDFRRCFGPSAGPLHTLPWASPPPPCANTSAP